MSGFELVVRNLVAWSVQVGVLGLGAAGLARLLPIERPATRLAFGQALLVLAIGLPLLQPWSAGGPSITWTVGPPSATLSKPVAGHGEAAVGFLEAWPALVVGLLVIGAGMRLARMCAGLLRLRTLRRSAPRLDEAPWLAVLHSEVAPRARLVTSIEVSTPATFGLRHPVVVLPTTFLSMEKERQEAIALHELLHARRGDWLPLMFEELLKAAFFFHPAVHWLVSRVRLAREQTVDAAVVARLGGRETYVESLVEVAKFAARARAVPAAPFFRESHLRERVDLLLKEVTMSHVRTLVHLSLTGAALVLVAAAAVSAVPLQRAALSPALPPDKTAAPEPKVVHKPSPTYPPEAKADKVEGIFLIDVIIGKDGVIRDARVTTSAPTLERLKALEGRTGAASLEGDERLATAALEAVKQWRYEPTIRDGQAVEARLTVTIRFRLE